MDISLHSFILVVGVIVIGFIVWDGVKKVRAARANQLNQSLDSFDALDVMPEEEELPAFDDLEIKDEILQQAFGETLEPSFEHVKSKVDHSVKADEKPESSAVDGTNSSVFEVLEPQKEAEIDVIAKEQDQSVEKQEDEFEHFSACDDVLAGDTSDQIVAKRSQVASTAKVNSTIDTANTEQAARASTVLSKSTAPKAEAVHESPKRVSKEALAAQLAKVKQEANEKISEPVVAVEEELTIDDKEPVPVLMEPVELGQKVDPNPPKQHELVLPEFIQQTLQDEPVYAIEEEPAPAPEKPDLLMEYIEDVQALPVGEKLSEREAAQEIFVINILKQDGKGLRGQDLQHVFKVCDMRHGEMDIFHRFEKANAQGKIQFSVVNAIEPGTFNLNTMNELVTPGISLFMSLPGPDKPMEAFDAMAEVALVFARNFDATLHDDTHSGLTPQTLEHYRNRVREFSRKHLSHKK